MHWNKSKPHCIGLKPYAISPYAIFILKYSHILPHSIQIQNLQRDGRVPTLPILPFGRSWNSNLPGSCDTYQSIINAAYSSSLNPKSGYTTFTSS